MATPRKKSSEKIDPAAHEALLLRIEHTLAKTISTPRVMWRSFVGGIMYAIGALVVVAIVIPFVVSFLQSIPWPPLVADFVTKVISQMEPTGSRPPVSSDGQ